MKTEQSPISTQVTFSRRTRRIIEFAARLVIGMVAVILALFVCACLLLASFGPETEEWVSWLFRFLGPTAVVAMLYATVKLLKQPLRS